MYSSRAQKPRKSASFGQMVGYSQNGGEPSVVLGPAPREAPGSPVNLKPADFGLW